MSKKRSDGACKALIKSLARKLGVEARLITTRLLSEDDKNDLRNGDLPTSSLECHIQAWIAKGCPDYAHGNTEPLEMVSPVADVAPVAAKRETKKRLVTPAPLVPPKPHNTWEFRKPFMRLEESHESAALAEPHHDEQSASNEPSPTSTSQ